MLDYIKCQILEEFGCLCLTVFGWHAYYVYYVT